MKDILLKEYDSFVFLFWWVRIVLCTLLLV